MSLRVLIVDDSSVMRKIIVRTLREAGLDLAEVLEAGDGREALEKARYRSDLDLILSDVNMPEMNGIEFVREARKIPDLRSIPIAMVTTEPTWKIMQEAVTAGATAYVAKPFTAAVLRQKIDSVLNTNGRP